MDNKYQDLHISNWKEHDEMVIRQVEIKQITFLETEILINFNKDKKNSTMIISKPFTDIKID